MSRGKARIYVTSAALLGLCLPAAIGVPAVVSLPSVNLWIMQLPGEAQNETVFTKAPQAIDVTIARVQPAGYPRFAMYPKPEETLDPNAEIVAHAVSTSNGENANSLQHTITIPALTTGLYYVRLSSRDRTAIQRLSVGTLGLVGARTLNDGVIMPIDLRTFRQRSDVRLTEIFATGARDFAPGRDGLIRFPFPWIGRTHFDPVASLVARASDGSIVALPVGWSDTAWDPWFSETDRTVYRLGDRVYTRSIARYSKPNVVTSSTALPMSPTTGYDSEDGVFVADTTRSPYVLEAGALTPEVLGGDTARFVISATDLQGAAAAGVPIRFAWHSLTIPGGFPLNMRMNDSYLDSLRYGQTRTDSMGNAVILLPTQAHDVEIYVFDPNDGAVAATARVHVLPAASGTIAVYIPFAGTTPRCFPLAIGVTDPKGRAKPDQPLYVEIRPEIGSVTPTPPPVLRRRLKTGKGGYAITPWCARELDNGSYGISATEKQPREPFAGDALQVNANPPFGRVEKALMVSADVAVARPGDPLSMTATSTSDGDAIVLYGSGFHYRALKTTFHNGIAHFRIIPPNDDDDFKVSVFLASRFQMGAATTKVTVEPKRHRLSVLIGCTKPSDNRGDTMKLCVHVKDWRGAGVSARLFATVTLATAASIANALANADAAYTTFFSPQDPNGDYIIMPDCLACGPRPSYLYPTPPPTPINAQPLKTVAHVPGATCETCTEPKTSALQPQTILWQNNLLTNPNGSASLYVGSKAARPGTYLIHIIALTRDSAIGTANAWISVGSLRVRAKNIHHAI